MVSKVLHVADQHPSTYHSTWVSTKGHGNRVSELCVINLGDCLLAKRKRLLEARYQLVLGPGCLDRVSGNGILGRARSLHRAKVVAEEIVVICNVLRDVADTQLRGRRLVSELRLRDGIERLRDVAVQRGDSGLEGGTHRAGWKRGRRLLRGENQRGRQAHNNET